MTAAALLERADLPLPLGSVPAHIPPAVVVGTSLAHPTDVVQVLVRCGREASFVTRATRDVATVGDPVQWFRAQLPALETDRAAEYRIEWLRAGRRIAALPADGSWYRLLGAAAAAPLPTTPADAPAGWPAQPRYRTGLEFFAALTVDLHAEVVGLTPEGYRINFYVVDGRVRGPKIDAVVEPRGGDWMCIRPDGIGAVNIKITYRTSDGALILEQAGGVFDTGPDGFAAVASGSLGGAPEFYATPTWSTSHAAWMWLNRRQGFGFGRVAMDKLQVRCDIYLPSVEG